MTDLLPGWAYRQAGLASESPAVIDGSTVWSWRDLDERADALASTLVSVGMHPGDRVGLLAGTSAAAIAFIHGAGRIGAVVVPLSERLTAAEARAFLDEVDARTVVAPGDLARKAREFGRPVHALDELAFAARDHATFASITGVSPAVIVATSGTTGRPKGAVLTHGQMRASAAAWNAFLPPATGWVASLSLAHVGGLGIVWRAALAGVPIVVPAAGDLESLAAALRTLPVSHASVVAVQLARLLDGGEAPPAGLLALLLGGGPISADLVARAVAAGWPLVPTYGMTESASGVAALATAEAAARPGSSGRALHGVELRVAEPGPDGIGDIEVRGPSLFEGYFARPAETAAVTTADGWYRTGDLGSLDAEGYLTVADRRLDLIVSGGENVYPAEVEAVLMSHPAVAEAGVAGRPDERWGAAPVAAVVLRGGATATPAQDIVAHCRRHLAAYKVPAEVLFLAELPKVGAGKLDRRALRSLLAVKPEPDEAVAAEARLPLRYLARPDGFRLAYRLLGPAESKPLVLMLHSTLSTGWQLKQLARAIADRGTALLPDRRGSGASRLATPRPVHLEEHVADALALLDELKARQVTVFGHSYGAVVALALAATHPERVKAVVVYEPPLLAGTETARPGRAADIAGLVRAAHARGGAPATAQAFLQAIGGAAVLDSASASTRAAILSEGDGVLADVGSIEAASVDLSAITCPVTLVTGDASEPFYAPIADAAAASMPNAVRVRLPGLSHNAPITQSAAIADLLRAVLIRD
jgi:o-succinylbenzoate---CoA ligase